VTDRRSLVLLIAVLAVGAAVVAAIVAGSSAPVQAAPDDQPADAGVQVEGVGTAIGTPDVLHVTVGVEASAASVAEALESANAAGRRVLEALHGAGVEEADVQTVDVHVWPRYDRDGQQITGYTAGQSVAATLRDLGTAGDTISAAVDAGGDAARLQGISYELEDDAALLAEARDAAFADARRKAEQYAELAGRELGDLITVEERVTPSGPVPVAMDAAILESSAVPLEAGSSEVTVSATVRWSLA
jgi:uncharacterized protein YggE